MLMIISFKNEYSDFKWYRPQAVSVRGNDDVFVTDLHRLIRIPADQLKDHSDNVVVVTGSKGKFVVVLHVIEKVLCNHYNNNLFK